MHAHSAANAYTQTTRSVGTPRSIEYQAFQRVTALLQAAVSPEAPFYKLAEAVHLNTKLWITLAADLLSPKNELPEQLNNQLFGLAEFSRRHGLKVLAKDGDAQDLIDVNTAVMRGLRGIGLTEDEASETSAGAAQTRAPASAAAAAAPVGG